MKISIQIEADAPSELREAIRALASLGSHPGVAAKAFADALKAATPAAAVEANAIAEEIATDTAVEDWPRTARVVGEPEAEPAASVAEPPKRERGKPDPASGRTRRTKAEIEEDERAEAAEAPREDPENELGGPSDVRYYVNESTDDLERVAPGDAPPKGKFWTQVSKRVFEGHRAMVDARKGAVASKFAEEVEAEAEPVEMPRVDTEDTYWFDTKKEEYFMVAAGDDLPPNTERYEEVTRRVYERAQKDAAPAPKAEPAKAVKLTLDDVLAKMDDLMNAVPTDKKGDAAMNANAVYKSFGAAKIKELKEEHYAPAIQKLEALIAEAKSARKGRG